MTRHQKWFLAIVLCASGVWHQAGGQETRSVLVTSTPTGAEILYNGQSRGAAPLEVILPEGLGSATIGARLDGYKPQDIQVPLTGTADTYDIHLDPSRAVIPVTVEGDLSAAADGVITLREALAYARGDIIPIGADRALITGLPGAGRPDDIIIETEIRSETPVLTILRPLPPLDDAGDRLIGTDFGATLAPVPDVPVSGTGLRIGPGTELAQFTIGGFDIGVEAFGWGSAFARAITTLGGQIGFHATEGAELFLSGAAAEASVAKAVATDGGIIDGIVEDMNYTDLEQLSALSGPPAEDELVVINGNLRTTGNFNVFVREDIPKPLSAVPGLSATTTSYDLYQIFGHGDSWQRWPRHVYDGMEGDYFQWAFRGEPTVENMQVISKRPLRTDHFTLHHLDNDSLLKKYRFSLFDRNRQAIWSTDITSDGTVDEIDVNPDLDFFGFRIDVLEAEGQGPGFTEIEAQIFDTVAYPSLSRNSRQVIFPRPPEGARGIVEIANRLHLVEDDLFLPVFSIASNQRSRALPTQETTVVTLDDPATGADLADAAAKYGYTQRLQVEVPGTLSIDATTPVITKPNLHLTGGGKITSSDGAPLRFEDADDLFISDLTFDGLDIHIVSTRRAGMHNIDLKGSDRGVFAQTSDVGIANSRLGGQQSAVHGEGSTLAVIGSEIHASGVGVNTQVSRALTLIGNTIDTGLEPLKIRNEGGYSHVAHLIANLDPSGQPEAAIVRESQNSNVSLVALNQPAQLGQGPSSFEVRTRPTWTGTRLRDMRTGSGPSHVRILDFGPDTEIRCLLVGDMVADAATPPSATVSPGTVVVFHDTPVSLICAKNVTGARLKLPLAQADGSGMPALAHLKIALSAEDSDDVITATNFVTEIDVIADGRPLKTLGSAEASDAMNGLVAALHKSGNYQLAFEKTYSAFASDPRNPSLEKLTRIAAVNWAFALQERGRFDAGRELLQDLQLSDPSPAGLEVRLFDLLGVEAMARTEAADWAGSRNLLREMKSLQPGNADVGQNIEYSYSKQSEAVVASQGVDGLVSWVGKIASEFPEEAGLARKFAGSHINAAVIVALDSGDLDNGMRLASVNHSLAPSDITAQNLRYAFEQLAMRNVAAGEIASVLEQVDSLREVHGDDIDFESSAATALGQAAIVAYNEGRFQSSLQIASEVYAWKPVAENEEILRAAFRGRVNELVSNGETDRVIPLLESVNEKHGALGLADELVLAFNNSAQTALDQGDAKTALLHAEQLYALVKTPDSANLLSYIYAIHAQNLSQAGSIDEALNHLAKGLKSHPELSDLANNAQIIGSNAALSAYESGNPARSIELFELTNSQFGGNETMRHNMLIIYSNWAVKAANDGDFGEAERIAEAGLRTFPDDAKLKEVRDYARSNR